MPAKRIVTVVLLVLTGLIGGLLPAASGSTIGPPESPETRQVMFVGNNWEGTATIIDARTLETLGTLDTIPDAEERMAEIALDPVRLGFYLAIQQLVGEGNDQYTDDMFTSHDGRFVYVSRPSFADVVSIDLRSGEIVWRFPMDGYRADHMAISPDGTRLLVSDSTGNVVHELDTADGEKTGEFLSGDSPHENVYVDDGARVLHASIGRVYTPTDQPALGFIKDSSKGERVFQVVDAETLEVLQAWDIGEELAEAGYEDMSAAVRPMAPHPDGRTVYFQVSFHHGFVEFDLEEGRVLRVADLPLSEEAESIPREQYLLDSAHHGLAIDASGERLCAAGTMSDYAAIVDVDSFEHQIASVGTKPYWSTNGPDGQHCWVSYSGDDEVAVIDYETAREVARIPVGDHPQRVRPGVIRHDILGDPDSILGAPSEVTRLSGADRYATAAAVATDTFPQGAHTVFLATGEDFADALSVGPVAGRAAGPVLLTRPDSLPAATAEALQALAPDRVVVVGGVAAVSEVLVADLRAMMSGVAVERVEGADRAGTAAAVAERFAPDGVPVVYVADGGAAPDALAGGPAAGADAGVMLLVGGDRVPTSTAAELTRLQPERIVILGGTSVVSAAVEEALGGFGAEVQRVAGADRFATAAAVAGAMADPVTAYVATGDVPADALVGAPAAIADGAPVLLVGRDQVPQSTRDALTAMSPTRIVLLGGTAAISEAVAAELESMLR